MSSWTLTHTFRFYHCVFWINCHGHFRWFGCNNTQRHMDRCEKYYLQKCILLLLNSNYWLGWYASLATRLMFLSLVSKIISVSACCWWYCRHGGGNSFCETFDWLVDFSHSVEVLRQSHSPCCDIHLLQKKDPMASEFQFEKFFFFFRGGHLYTEQQRTLLDIVQKRQHIPQSD